MPAEIVALLVLIGFAVAAVVFTLIFIVAVDRSVANERRGQEQCEEENRDPGSR